MAADAEANPEASSSSNKEKTARRKIPGGLPYTSSPGVLKRVIDRIPTTEKPGTFNTDFLGTVMGATGGAARPIIPILKATGLLNQSGNPTELYAQFQTDAGRPVAALQALRNGFGEIFGETNMPIRRMKLLSRMSLYLLRASQRKMELSEAFSTRFRYFRIQRGTRVKT